MEKIEKDKEFLQTAQATIEAETKEMVQVSDRLHDNLVKALRLMGRQLFIIWAVVILLVIAYFFDLNKTSSTSNVATPEPETMGKSVLTSEITISAQGPPTQQSVTDTPISELRVVQGILEQVREAQLKKDIGLFLKTYSPTFPDLGKKKETILKTWQKFDYLDMRFNIENVQQTDAQTITAKVVWIVTLEDVHSKEKKNFLKDYTIHFSHVSGKWLIQELIQEEKMSKVAAKLSDRSL